MIDVGEPEPLAQLRSLLRERAVLRGNFILSSGQRSSHYIDARLVTLSAHGGVLVGHVFLASLAGEEIHAVAGLTLGADPIVSAIAIMSGLEGRAIDGLIVRKRTKSHGAGRRIEGPWRSGLRVAVVDDTLTTGASALEAARAVEEEGGIVSGVWALIDREQGAAEAIATAGYRFSAIYRAADLL
jgi:orotate phosphoribosyltransferase